MTSPDEAIERFELAFFSLFRKLGPELGLPPDLSITGPQLMMLYSIIKMQPCPTTKLAQQLEVTPSAITVMIDRLVNHGYVVRKADEHDRRVVLLEVTEQGHQVLQTIKELRTQAVKTYLSYLEPEEFDLFLNIFEKIAHNINNTKVDN
ncbi:MarR family winged helix-turn-helix transcriptional regulator [Paenibacillus cremeus]|uniref:MarR family transcriptional regulator n=1 Tax=Paenibacillus cremeus TaxID=2163881 RepID=A0A559KA87_9BACL|nr:MarR family transcriptional regulator [Paenibacillus cremeus]TVY09019.1 MarR family transcriptional regulator [Paenibacillus cremeus]